jgi:hypothetical protein
MKNGAHGDQDFVCSYLPDFEGTLSHTEIATFLQFALDSTPESL